MLRVVSVDARLYSPKHQFLVVGEAAQALHRGFDGVVEMAEVGLGVQFEKIYVGKLLLGTDLYILVEILYGFSVFSTVEGRGGRDENHHGVHSLRLNELLVAERRTDFGIDISRRELPHLRLVPAVVVGCSAEDVGHNVDQHAPGAGIRLAAGGAFFQGRARGLVGLEREGIDRIVGRPVVFLPFILLVEVGCLLDGLLGALRAPGKPHRGQARH